MTVREREKGTSRRGATQANTLLLAAGVAAGPLYVLVAAAQAWNRGGFDIRRHAVSLLSNGELGWIQITNFVVVGLLVVFAALGMARTSKGRRGGTWGPRLIGIYGLCLVASGLLVADPAFGFPIGTPEGPPTEATWQGVGHFVAGGIGFTALVAACFVFARHLADGNRVWSAYSATTGAVFFGSFAAVAAGGGASWANLVFTAGVVLAWTWLSLTTARMLVTLRGTAAEERGVGR